MSGRLIIDGACGPAWNMAVDEALARRCDAGDEGFPVFRLYWWTVPTLSLGAKERLEEAADVDACREAGIGLVRRATGGRSVLHDKELTYAVIGRQGTLPYLGDVAESYRVIAEALRRGIAAGGIELSLTAGSIKIRPRTGDVAPGGTKKHLPCFAAPSRYELSHGGKKVVGSAQRRLRHSVLQHGSILLDVDTGLLASATGATGDSQLVSVMTGLSTVANRTISREELMEPLADAMAKACDVELVPGQISPEERNLAEELLPVVKNRLPDIVPDHG